jgi:hypothetical protein
VTHAQDPPAAPLAQHGRGGARAVRGTRRHVGGGEAHHHRRQREERLADKVGGLSAGAFARAQQWVLVQGTATGATILAQSGGMSATRQNTGLYSIDTGASVGGHPLSATINLGGLPGFVDAAPCGGSANNPGGVNCAGANDTNHVLAQTLSTAAAAADRTFYLAIGG